MIIVLEMAVNDVDSLFTLDTMVMVGVNDSTLHDCSVGLIGKNN